MKKISIALTGCATVMLLSFSYNFDLKASIERGKTIYAAQCASCHMQQGEGLATVYPPLAKSNNLADKNRLVKIVLQGMRGPVKVNGVEYNTMMAPVPLNDEGVADVLNFVRNSWGNQGKAITPAEIRPALKATVKGYQPF